MILASEKKPVSRYILAGSSARFHATPMFGCAVTRVTIRENLANVYWGVHIRRGNLIGTILNDIGI